MSVKNTDTVTGLGKTPFSALSSGLASLRLDGPSLMALLTLVAIAVFALVVPPFLGDVNSMGADSFAPPSLSHLMGTDDLGRDVFSRFAHGARMSLSVGVLAALTACIIGIVLGAIAGYMKGAVDVVLMRIAELFQVIPRFFLALLVIALFGANVVFIILTIGLLGWPEVARITRGEFLSLREREYVLAARAGGQSTRAIIFSEILPNAMPPLIVAMTMQVSSAILLEAGLSFLGLGDASNPSWGLMLNEAQQFLTTAWWMAVFPGLGILVTVAALNVFGDHLTDVLNPRLRGAGG
ncbi:ABC transporter permease [Chelativorans sp. J32]|uniref:ABC transporter permease n=1 Tax=Chelativorans sp. J32 TaxID=935840 RepID=UPI0006887650|nr:ABC transporter permease [Chelativorans sp. J32]